MNSRSQFLAAQLLIRLRTAIAFGVALGLLAAFPLLAHALIDVWIDPGHGGGDPGSLGVNGAPLPNEKQFNIGVTNFLEAT